MWYGLQLLRYLTLRNRPFIHYSNIVFSDTYLQLFTNTTNCSLFKEVIPILWFLPISLLTYNGHHNIKLILTKFLDRPVIFQLWDETGIFCFDAGAGTGHDNSFFRGPNIFITRWRMARMFWWITKWILLWGLCLFGFRREKNFSSKQHLRELTCTEHSNHQPWDVLTRIPKLRYFINKTVT